jgi:hypothetical protein
MANPAPATPDASRNVRNLGQRRCSEVAFTQCRSVEQPTDLCRRRFTARSGEDRSAGRAGMDGVEPRPLLAAAAPFATTARDNRKLTKLDADDKGITALQ